jgi:membrane protease YdiL (CAAX protease family)
MSPISKEKHSTVAFFALTYLITWALWIPFVILAPSSSAIGSNSGLRGSPLMLLQVLGNFGPTFAAILLLMFSGNRGELRDLFGRLRPHRSGLIWYVAVLLLPIGILLPGLLVYALLGGNTANFSIMGLLSLFVAAIFVSGLGEEMGWRGYALSRLQMTRSPFMSSLIIGLVWGLWHLPVIYWASSQTGVLFLIEFVLYMLLLTAFSVVFTWVYNATNRSLWMVVLMHAAFTGGGNTIAAFVQPAMEGSWIPYIVNVLSAVIVAVLVIASNRARMLYTQNAQQKILQ